LRGGQAMLGLDGAHRATGRAHGQGLGDRGVPGEPDATQQFAAGHAGGGQVGVVPVHQVVGGQHDIRSQPEIAGLAAKIDREEAYHRMHAQMWFERLQDEPRFKAAVDELRALLEARDDHTPELAELLEEMTMVRRSVAGATW